MPPLAPVPSAPRRLPASARRAEILAAAALAIDAQGYLPIPYELVARAAGVSKALVYAYFPTQGALCNALLAQALGELAAGFAALRQRRLPALARAAAGLYLEETLRRGSALHLLLTDPCLDGQRDPAALALRDAMWRQLLRADRRRPIAQRMAALQIALAIPEELGRLVHRGELTADRARELSATLIDGALSGVS
ncbi:MAG TPA: TetR/AcrR family transcriptional regulator [Caulobacteraceae bacterium]|jgi:AcrR family transcriptional regulator